MFQLLLQAILIIFSITLIFILYISLIGPLIDIYKIKKKYGDKVKIYYYPVLGYARLRSISLQKYKDSIQCYASVFNEDSKKQMFYAIGLSGLPIRIILDPELAKQIMQNPPLYEKDRTFFFEAPQKEWFSAGLFWAEGESWKRQRSIFAKAFHFQTLKEYVPVVNSVAKACIQEDIKIGESNKVVEHCCNITGRVVTSTFFDEEFHKNKLEDQNFIPYLVQTIWMVSNYSLTLPHIVKRKLFGNYIAKRIFLNKYEAEIIQRIQNIIDLIRKYVENSIELRTNVSKAKSDKRVLNDLLDEYDQGQMSITEIIDSFIIIFFAGTDTTGNLAGVALHVLAQDQALQQRIHDDILNYFKSTRENFDPQQDFDVNFEDISQINSLNNLIKETLRLYTPATGLVRKIVKDHKIGDFEMKKGESIISSYNSVFRCERYFKNSFTFDIDRWDKSETKKMDPFIFVPFSAGPKNCVGQHLSLIEAKVMLIQNLLRFKLTPNPNTEFSMVLRFVRTPKDDNLVIFNKRY